jgi:hypothetical protein
MRLIFVKKYLKFQDTVAAEGERLAVEMGKLTKEVRLGFGSFVDKPLLPFAAYEHLQ